MMTGSFKKLRKGKDVEARPYPLFQETCLNVAQLVKPRFLIVQDKGKSCKPEQRMRENPNL